MARADHTDSETFLKVQYTDLKESFKQLFTLITGVFVFSATFGEKSGGDAAIGHLRRLFFFSPYIILMLALGLCCVGHYLLVIAGDKATGLKLWGYRLRSYEAKGFAEVAVDSSTALEAAGVLFLLGLLMLAVVAVFH